MLLVQALMADLPIVSDNRSRRIRCGEAVVTLTSRSVPVGFK